MDMYMGRKKILYIKREGGGDGSIEWVLYRCASGEHREIKFGIKKRGWVGTQSKTLAF